MYRFLLTPRWLGNTVLAVAAIAVCLWLGSWQLGRFEDRVVTHHAKSTAPAAAPGAASPLDSVLTAAAPLVQAGSVGREVTASGSFDVAHQLLVPNRTVDGKQGYYVLTPLRTAGGRAVAVVRGWVAGAPGTPPAPPAGQVTVTGRLQAPETSDSAGAVAGGLPAGQLGTIDPATLVNLLPYGAYDGWVAEDGGQAGLTPVPTTQPEGGDGLTARAFQNLGYTLEWFVFAGFVGFMWFRLLRREAEAAQDRALGLDPVLET
ncbi:cytochrome oxidase assembly protein ShyY1 [Kitasatospora sp. MAA4]|uniref:SURF1 family protein n=1 Tax=Kitasatospora sp. MAA4 TaxID=3035093 RepID=UPI0024743783|nr:SURF1 family protein [Kitasatospora sp. MAA4]MDH6132718.1 cytochrome oxidase assembly protein ShyY1 [Kitasatospora sp. MAA4]